MSSCFCLSCVATELNLKDTQIDNDDLYSILSSTYKLKKLNLENAKNIKIDGSLDMLLMSLSGQNALEELNLKGVSINEEGLLQILSSVPSLKKLNLENCSEISEEIKNIFASTVEAPDFKKAKEILNKRYKPLAIVGELPEEIKIKQDVELVDPKIFSEFAQVLSAIKY